MYIKNSSCLLQVKPTVTAMEGYHPMSDIPAFITKSSDPILTSEFMDVSIYASSPNSIFMYEQEKVDMQSSMGLNTSCTSVETGLTDEFDLKTQYEVSQDISHFPMTDLGPSTSHTVSSNYKKDVYIKTEDLHEMSLTPTLAELNMNMDLLEDINSYINVEMGQYVPQTMVQSHVVKVEPVSSLSHDSKEMTDDILGQAGGSSHAGLTTLTNVTPQRITIKSEPIDIPMKMRDGTRGASYPESYEPMTAIKPELIVPRSLPISMSAPLSTIKEIDISDFTTLQNLLKQSEPSQARGQTSRRRTVSETQLLQKPPQPQRKRSIGAAGLEMDKKWEEIKQFLSMETQNTAEAALTQPPTGRRERIRYGNNNTTYLNKGK